MINPWSCFEPILRCRSFSVSGYTNARAGLDCFWRVDLGVCHLKGFAEVRGLAEKHIFAACGQTFAHFSHSLKPHTVDSGGAVGEQSDKPHGGTFSHYVETYEATPQLEHRELACGSVQASHGIGARTVDIACGVVTQKVVGIMQPQFRAKKLGSFGAYAFHKFYVVVAQRQHSPKQVLSK